MQFLVRWFVFNRKDASQLFSPGTQEGKRMENISAGKKEACPSRELIKY